MGVQVDAEGSRSIGELRKTLDLFKSAPNLTCHDHALHHATVSVASALRRDLSESNTSESCSALLQTICTHLLRESYNDDVAGSAAGSALLCALSWDLFDLVMPYVEVSERCSETELDTGASESVAISCSHKLLVEMADVCSPRELHLMAMAHVSASPKGRKLHVLLMVLRRDMQRLPPLQRKKFLVATLEPVSIKLSNLAKNSKVSSGEGREDTGESSDEDSNEVSVSAEAGKPMSPSANCLVEKHKCSSPGDPAFATAESTAFAGPLLLQALNEKLVATWEDSAAVNQCVAAFMGFLLSALRLAVDAAAPTREECNGNIEGVEVLVEFLLGSPAVDLQYVLEQSIRSLYKTWEDRMLEGNMGRSPQHGCRRSKLGDFTVTGPLSWSLDSVASLAYVVACKPVLRRKWLPSVWSPTMYHRMMIPHALTLLRARSEGSTSKGLELICEVGNNLGSATDSGDPSTFSWRQGATTSNGCDEGVTVMGSMQEQSDGDGKDKRPCPFVAHSFDLAELLQLLISAMISCPHPELRSRGRSTFETFLTHTDMESRFFLLQHLIGTCPWPNATGLLLDSIRKQIHLALGPLPPLCDVKEIATSRSAMMRTADLGGKAALPDTCLGRPAVTTKKAPEAVDKRASRQAKVSPFSSAPVGELICDQIKRLCSGKSSELLDNLDMHMGALALVRYAYMLDKVHSGPLGLWIPTILEENKNQLQDFSDSLQVIMHFPSNKVDTKSAGSAQDHHPASTTNSSEYLHQSTFLLYLVKDAVDQCLNTMSQH